MTSQRPPLLWLFRCVSFTPVTWAKRTQLQAPSYVGFVKQSKRPKGPLSAPPPTLRPDPTIGQTRPLRQVSSETTLPAPSEALELSSRSSIIFR